VGASKLMGFDFKTWAKSWGNSWLNSWGLGQDEERSIPTVSIRKKEEFFEEELALLLYASKY
jgi:hypothetical protein